MTTIQTWRVQWHAVTEPEKFYVDPVTLQEGYSTLDSIPKILAIYHGLAEADVVLDVLAREP